MKKLRIAFMGLFFILLVLSIIWGWRGISEFNSVTIDYGFPYIWGTSIITEEIKTVENFPSRFIVSAYETWRVSTLALLFDLLFWMGLLTTAATIPTKLPKPKIPRIKISIEQP